MSSRSLRRLEKQLEQEKCQDNDDINEEQATDETPTVKTFMFQLLAESEEEEEEEEGEKALSQADDTNKRHNNASKQIDKEAKPRGNKRNHTSKKSVKAQAKQTSDSSDFDFDEELSKLQITDKDQAEAQDAKHHHQFAFLQIDYKHIDSTIELKQKVGGFDTEEAASGRGRKPPSSHKRTTPKTPKKQLIVARSNWPKITSSMVELKVEPLLEDEVYGNDCYQICPTKLYENRFEEFATLVEIGDIELIYSFLTKNPFQIDALLVLSEYMRMTSAASEAIEVVERALYILEKSLWTCEGLALGTSRFPYSIYDNRRFHVVLLQHVQLLVKRGCYRTAFEFCKLLLSLDPFSDPMGVRLMVDFLAIQCDQFEWFDQVYSIMIEAEAPWLANWHFSRALKMHIQGQSQAQACLEKAISAHPWMVPNLASACGITIDASEYAGEHSKSPPVPEHIRPLCEVISRIYAQRCSPLWKSMVNLPLLQAALEKKFVKSPEVYEPTALEALSIFRHSVLSDLKGVQVSIPVTISSSPIRIYDPLPPEDLDPEPAERKCLVQ